MSYIGNEPTSVAFLTDTFSGNGSTTAFTLSAAPANTSSILVAISGVLQDPSTYSVSGTTLTFSPAPPSGTGNISVRFLGIPASGVTTTAYRTVTEFTATAGQTTFSVPSYTPGFIDVYRNGVMLGSADYTASNGVSVVLVNACTAGDLVEVISFQVSSVLNAIPGTSGSVGTTLLADGAVTPAKLSTGAPTWDTSGNVGIGTSSPSQKLTVSANSNDVMSVISTGDTNADLYLKATGTTLGNVRLRANANDMVFITGLAERMRLDSAGRLNVNCTGNPLPSNGPGRINMIVPSGDDGVNIKHDHTGNCLNIWRTAGNGNVLNFYQSSPPTQTQVGSISTTGSSTAYNTSSDYRLKENIAPMTGALAKVSALKPCTYTWKVDGSEGQGFIAHELAEVVPDAVVGEKDDVNEDGSIKPQGIDTSFLVATLTAAIQEQQQIIEDLKARIEVLEAK